MTPNQTNNPVASDAASAVPQASSMRGPGAQIRAAREALPLSLEALAQQTRLAKLTLDALERDDFKLLNEAVYIRGYYRKIAKALSIDEHSLISAYEAVVQHKGPPVPTKLLLGSGDNGPHRARRRVGWSWLLAIIVIGALLFLALRFVGHTAPPTAGLSETLSSAESSKPSNATAPDSSATDSAALPSAPVSELPSSSTSTSTAAQSAPATVSNSSAQPSTAASAATPADSGNGLVLTFKSTSWVRVEDNYGKVLLSGVIQAGERQSVDGRRPLSVFLGNAPGVSATDAGKPIEIASHIKDNATARFTVP